MYCCGAIQKARARADHLFGFMTNSTDVMNVCRIGILRAAAKFGLTNLAYTEIVMSMCHI
jgi:hypothetical protein